MEKDATRAIFLPTRSAVTTAEEDEAKARAQIAADVASLRASLAQAGDADAESHSVEVKQTRCYSCEEWQLDDCFTKSQLQKAIAKRPRPPTCRTCQQLLFAKF